MRLYVWTGVLPDYTDGMIVALAPDLETALEVARQQSDYGDVATGEMGRVTPVVTELPGCEALEPRYWEVHGGG